MSCLCLTVFLPMKSIRWTALMLLWSSLRTGFGGGQGGGCRPFCSGSDCIVLHQDWVDFKSAEEACRDRNGELMTLHTEADRAIFDVFSLELGGDFWIGLRLPVGTCSNLSAPLRGYRWTSGSVDSSLLLSSCTWTDSFEVCSPSCVSLSNEQRLTERPCTERTDGYLCRMNHQHACQAQRLSDPVFRSSEGCSSGPCEHTCTDVQGGYKCSCFRGYIPDSSNLRRCKVHCSDQKCPAVCQGSGDSGCFCPDGYLMTDKVCEDIDECAHKWCDQECKNTFGGFVCSCREGFVLRGRVKCIRKVHDEGHVDTTPIAVGSARPAKNTTYRATPAAAGHFLWIWIVLALAVVVFIVVIRLYVVKHKRGRGQNLNPVSSVPADNREC